MVRKTDKPPNATGRNQHRSGRIIDDIPDIVERIQKYLNDGLRLKEIPDALASDLPGATISVRSIKRFIQKNNIQTTRKSGLTDLEKGMAILKIKEDDPLGRWGARRVKEKLAHEQIHIPRDFITRFLSEEDPLGAERRNPHIKKKHKLTSAGPNEEWGIDGHDKITACMGISIIGIIDKFSRLELGLFAVPNNRVQAVAIACWIRVVHCRGGMSVTMTTDKGGEWNTLISIATELRTQFQEFIPEDLVPTVTSVTSTVNITRERNWRPLWENELSNIAEQYKSGQLNAGYHPNDDFHQMVARWVWARIVQDRLDKLIEENGRHRIRKQKKSLLPTGGRRIDFYTKPHLWGGEDVLIPIPQDDLNRLLALYYDPELFQFGTNEFVALCSDLHHAIGSPPFVATAGWSIFTRMIQEYCDRQAPNGD